MSVVDDREAVICSVCSCDVPKETSEWDETADPAFEAGDSGGWVCEDCLFLAAQAREQG